ncbi:MAG TPA: MBL fold metallo-hydrolase, partial [Gemmatimonadaceae bacterium]
MQELLPNIYTWSWFSETHGYNFNGYLVCDAEGNLCIDPVQPGDDLAEIERLGVAKILLTNRNHSRGSNLLRERTNAPVYMHPDDAAHAVAQGTPIDGELLIGEK